MAKQTPRQAELASRRSRGALGRFESGLSEAERAARVLELRRRGCTYQQIADEVGYADKSAAFKAFRAAMRPLLEEMAEDAAEIRRLELERLDAAEAAVNTVLEREHITVSHGHVVTEWVLDGDGNPIVIDHDDEGKPIYRTKPLLDDAPVLQAVDRLLRIQQRRAALLGLDAPTKIEQAGHVTYEITGVDPDAIV